MIDMHDWALSRYKVNIYIKFQAEYESRIELICTMASKEFILSKGTTSIILIHFQTCHTPPFPMLRRIHAFQNIYMGSNLKLTMPPDYVQNQNVYLGITQTGVSTFLNFLLFIYTCRADVETAKTHKDNKLILKYFESTFLSFAHVNLTFKVSVWFG